MRNSKLGVCDVRRAISSAIPLAFQARVKNQRHSVTGRNLDQSPAVRPREIHSVLRMIWLSVSSRARCSFIESLDNRHVYEQNMANFELNFLLTSAMSASLKLADRHRAKNIRSTFPSQSRAPIRASCSY